MSFKVELLSQPKKFLRSIDSTTYGRIIKKLEILQKYPIIPDTKIIKNSKKHLFRVRVGDYRILYYINFKTKTITIFKISKRSKAYLLNEECSTYIINQSIQNIFISHRNKKH